jgi:hypothetical protein
MKRHIGECSLARRSRGRREQDLFVHALLEEGVSVLASRVAVSVLQDGIGASELALDANVF